MSAGWIGAIIGTIFGLIGGVIGTYFSIKNTKGPKERAFMVKVSVIAWIAVITFLGLFFTISGPYRYFLYIPYGILLPIGIHKCNKKQAEIRRLESEDETDSARA